MTHTSRQRTNFYELFILWDWLLYLCVLNCHHPRLLPCLPATSRHSHFTFNKVIFFFFGKARARYFIKDVRSEYSRYSERSGRAHSRRERSRQEHSRQEHSTEDFDRGKF